MLDGLYFRTLLRKSVGSFGSGVRITHQRKLLRLGIQQPKFVSPADVIFNFSDYKLSKKEKFLLSLGLDFCLPNYKPNFASFFLPFELFFNNLRNLPNHLNLEKALNVIQEVAHKTYSSIKRTRLLGTLFSSLKFQILRKLSKVKELVICRPDKGKGIVLLNRSDYVNKMHTVLSDSTKFSKIGEPKFSLIFKVEDKINRTLRQFKENSVIDEPTYNKLYSSGSSFSILCGLPQIHKQNVPLCPILAAYNAPNFHIAKYLVPLLNHLSINRYSLPNSHEFTQHILNEDATNFMVSVDVQSLFTNVPLLETIDIILNKLFTAANSVYHGFNRDYLKKLLELSVLDTYFIFNGEVFKQTDGMAMRTPLGPIFANIFLCFLEDQFLNQCPLNFKPIFYRRYVDDAFMLFRNQNHAKLFLDFVNTFHSNINFTMESENNNKLAFLDILISRSNGRFSTGVYRKDTFIGLGLNFFSFCPLNFKLNSCKTLLYRAYSLCSDWFKFDEEVSTLR